VADPGQLGLAVIVHSKYVAVFPPPRPRFKSTWPALAGRLFVAAASASTARPATVLCLPVFSSRLRKAILRQEGESSFAVAEENSRHNGGTNGTRGPNLSVDRRACVLETRELIGTPLLKMLMHL
jgi:hypothetical protein